MNSLLPEGMPADDIEKAFNPETVAIRFPVIEMDQRSTKSYKKNMT